MATIRDRCRGKSNDEAHLALLSLCNLGVDDFVNQYINIIQVENVKR